MSALEGGGGLGVGMRSGVEAGVGSCDEAILGWDWRRLWDEA